MIEFFYFSTLKLLVKAQYATETNSIRYATHRCLTLDEKKIVERFILKDFAPKTDYYHRMPSLFLYMGVDSRLQEKLPTDMASGTIKTVMSKDSAIDQKVRQLIDSSLSNYYFEQIGAKLLLLREITQETLHDKPKIESILLQLIMLLDAYNSVSGQRIPLEALVPEAVLKFRQQSFSN